MAAFFASVFSSLFAFLASYISKKVALGAAVVATLLTTTTAFYVVMKALVAGVAYSISNQYLLMGFYAVWPSNAETCLAAIFAAEIAAFLYRHQLLTIKAVSGVN